MSNIPVGAYTYSDSYLTSHMKTTIFYDEMCVPEQIRIKSDKLCLDHTFSPNATLNCINYRDINSLLENPLFDTIQINLAKGTAYYEEYDGTLKPIP